MAQTPTRCSERVVHSARKFTVVEEQFLLPSGRTFSLTEIRHPGAVVILPIRPDGSILFVRQYRYPLQKEILELPAGTLNAAEEPLSCAKRELREEIGCSTENWSSLGWFYSAPGFCNEVLHGFVAADLRQGQSHPEEEELIQIVALTPAQAIAAAASGEISDAKSICLLYRAQLAGVIQ